MRDGVPEDGVPEDGAPEDDGVLEDGAVHPVSMAIAWLAVAAVLVAVIFIMLRQVAPSSPVVSPAPINAVQLHKLPQATTFTSIPAAPLDQAPATVTTGAVIHPLSEQVLYAAPGQPAFGILPDTELGNPTWVPVVNTSPGWVQVLLPCRPNHATGWIYTAGPAGAQLQIQQSTYLIMVDVHGRTLTIDDGGQPLGTWPVAVGTPQTPTPTGRTFLLGLLEPPQPTYSPFILPLGAHSNVWSSFGGGPGTVGLHGWPDPSVFGQAVSNGCIRVPSPALQKLTDIPLGTLVMIT